MRRSIRIHAAASTTLVASIVSALWLAGAEPRVVAANAVDARPVSIGTQALTALKLAVDSPKARALSATSPASHRTVDVDGPQARAGRQAMAAIPTTRVAQANR